ncbi:cysteine hydrolase family protein [Pseudonocardia phyllosphaerae]|uniref:cysteine hydrolase n=1 Tax=Pseudonocardia phyllosphaerae TaxID=3390502 RepID=UPI00397E6FF8
MTLPALDPRSTAVLAMDFQPGIMASIEQRSGAPAPIDTVVDVLDVARKAGTTVGYVRVALTPEEAEAAPAHSQFGKMVAAGAAPGLAPDAATTAVDDRIAPQPGDIVVRKSRIGAFSTTDLDEQLRAAGVTTLVLTGIATSGVVLSTVRDAADRDYRIVVLSDACADGSPEVHDALVEKVLPAQATVTTSDRLAGMLGL